MCSLFLLYNQLPEFHENCAIKGHPNAVYYRFIVISNKDMAIEPHWASDPSDLLQDLEVMFGNTRSILIRYPFIYQTGYKVSLYAFSWLQVSWKRLPSLFNRVNEIQSFNLCFSLCYYKLCNWNSIFKWPHKESVRVSLHNGYHSFVLIKFWVRNSNHRPTILRFFRSISHFIQG